MPISQIVRRREPTRSRRPRAVIAAAVAIVVAGGGVAVASTTGFGTRRVNDDTPLGAVLPGDQYLKPYGSRLLVSNGKLLDSAVRPGGRYVAALTTDRTVAVTVADLSTGKVVSQAGSGAGVVRMASVDVGQEGPTWSPDGTQLWVPQISGLARFPVAADGTLGAPTVVSLPAQGTQEAVPAGAVFSRDGSTLYVAANGQNRVLALDPATGAIEHSWTTGYAPRELVLDGDTLWVSDEGGRPARAGESTLESYGTQVPASHVTGATTTGVLSVIDTARPDAAVGTVPVGLHPTALHLDRGRLFVADTGSDQVSVVDTRTRRVRTTISTRPWSGASVGYEPSGVVTSADGRLLVTLARANAVAVYAPEGRSGRYRPVGLLPTDYLPSAVTTLGQGASQRILVTNLRGIGARGPQRTIDKGVGTTPATGHNSHDATGTFQTFTLPSDRVVAQSTALVFAQNGWDAATTARPRRDARPVPVPARLGEPSTIKHVFLIVKENRSYDQVLGDDTRGNGDPALAQFGAHITPNQHALARQFGLYDNAYDVATNSAEGHNWVMEADDPEYVESQGGEYERSYDSENDALGHQRSGFLWTGAQAAGRSVRDFGEYNAFFDAPAGTTWQDYYCEAQHMASTGEDTRIHTTTSSPIPSLQKVTNPDYPLFELGVPDQYRYQVWKRDFERNGPSNLNMLWLPDDHTGGAGSPSGIAQVADNDLALGRIVDTISHSRWWRSSAIFVVQDDTQDGVDHVDGTRAPIQVISPWAQHGTVDSHYYSIIGVVRTIEQILGITPMNQKDSAATPMFTAFTRTADDTPFDTRANQVPLTYGLTTQPACGADQVPAARRVDLPSLAPVATPQGAAQRALKAEWTRWEGRQHLTGVGARPDYAAPEQMDRFTWYESHGWATPYPGDRTVLRPSQVPGGTLPPADAE